MPLNQTGIFTCACGAVDTGTKQTSNYTFWYSEPKDWYKWFDGVNSHMACSLSCFEKMRGLSLGEFRVSMRGYVNKDRDGMICLPGGLGCPWCIAENNTTGEISICLNGHKWRSLPWGG